MSNTKLEQIKKKYKAPEYKPYSHFELHFTIKYGEKAKTKSKKLILKLAAAIFPKHICDENIFKMGFI